MAFKEPGNKSLILHLHPRRVNAATLRWDYTLGLGGMAVVLFIAQVFSGVLLRFHYIPSPADAYGSILGIQSGLIFGQFTRNLHHWAGMAFVIIAFLHLVRVFYTNAWHAPRRTNWIIGVIMLILVVAMNFSGYLLPWDQRSFWAVTVGTSMLEYIPVIGNILKETLRGGADVDSATLINFFSLHTGILPVVFLVLMVYHFWRIRKARGLALSEQADNTVMVDTVPHLVLRELVVALVLIAGLFLVSLIFDAPLLEKANPAFSPNPAKAPWYFLGVQELMLHFHPFFAVFLIPLIFLISLLVLPYIQYNHPNPGIWFHSRKGRKMVINTAVTSLIFTTAAIIAGEYLIDFAGWLPGLPLIITEGLISFLLVALLAASIIVLMKRYFDPASTETTLLVFTFLAVAYLVLMFTGIWFRGEGMILKWPWLT